MLHKWVILRPPGSASAAAASRGFLKLCISVLTANDPTPSFARPLPLPPPECSEPDADALRRVSSRESVLDTLSIGGREDVETNLWLPGGVQRQPASLVLYLYRAEDIPPGISSSSTSRVASRVARRVD